MIDGCIVMTVHGVKHYLHSTPARQLEKMLAAKNEGWNAVDDAEQRRLGIPAV